MITTKDIQGKREYICLNALLSCHFQIACQEQLEGTPYYRQGLKNASKVLVRQLESSIAKDIGEVWGVKDSSMYSLMDYIENTIKELSSLSTEYIGVVYELVKKFKETPQEVMDYLKVQLVDDIPVIID